MKIKLLIVCVLMLVFSYCAKKTETVSVQFLNPNSSITSTQILKLDWERLPVDIPTYYYKNKDTTVTFTLCFDSSIVISQKWEITFNEIDSISLDALFSNYESYIFPPINFQELSSKSSYFTIFNYPKNIYFAGNIYRQKNGTFLLTATHRFPIFNCK